LVRFGGTANGVYGSHYATNIGDQDAEIVHPDQQNQGIGTRLMHEIEQAFDHARRFELFTGDRSTRNLYLYGKLGYRAFKRQAISDRVTLVFLEKTGPGS